MKLIDYTAAKKTELGVEGTGITVTTKKERIWRNKLNGEPTLTIPAGSTVHIDFMPKTTPGTILITFGDEVKHSMVRFAHQWLNGFKKPPTLSTLEKRSWTGKHKSVTGKTVEADGYGPDGSPSWELVLGII